MNRFMLMVTAVVLLASCRSSLPAMKDYSLNEVSFKVYEGWKEEIKEEGKLKMMLYTPGSLWGSFSLMRYDGLDGEKVYENIRKSFPGMGHTMLKDYAKDINGIKFEFMDFQNGDKTIPLKYGTIGIAQGTGYSLAVQIFSEFQGLDHEQNAELKALVDTIIIK